MPRKFRTPWSQRTTNVVDAGPTVTSVPGQEKDVSIEEKSSDQLDAAADIVAFEKSHQWDPNLPQAEIDALHHAAKTGDAESIREVEETFAEDSPYEEVRAAVRNIDDGSVANTVRAWILGMIFVTVGSGLNMFLSMRSAILLPELLSD
jgi:hypothetical protein